MLRCGFSMSRMCFGTRGLCSIEKATKAKPILTSPHTYISFFLFEHIKNPSSVADALRDKLMTQNFRGTIYVAPEGINGQFSIKNSQLPMFKEIITNAHPAFSSISFNLGDSYEEGECKADIKTFKRLSVKTRQFILTDGLDDKHRCLDWKQHGSLLSADRWHKEVEALSAGTTDTILLDCRNDYEIDMGTFKGAIPLNTKVFSDAFPALEPLLRDMPKDKRVLTFCTGGIRCMKVNAYLSQQLGFTNTATLRDGIVGYKRWLESGAGAGAEAGAEADASTPPTSDSDSELGNDSIGETVAVGEHSGNGDRDAGGGGRVSSLFVGDNYVFDRRRVQDMTQPSRPSSALPADTTRHCVSPLYSEVPTQR